MLAAVAECLACAVMQDMRWAAKERHGLASAPPLHANVFTLVQRFRSDLGLYVHLHCLVTDGAFEEHDAEVRFLPAPPSLISHQVDGIPAVHPRLEPV